MFSVIPEPVVSKPAYDPQAKQTRAEQPSSDGFAALVDSNASANSDPRPAPDRPVAPRRDTRDARQADAPAKGKDRPQADSSTGSANNDSSAAQQDADPSAPTDTKAASGKTGGKDKTASDATKTDDKSGDATAANTATPIIPAIVTDPVAVVIAAAADPAAVTGDSATSTATATATAAIVGVTTITPTDAQTPAIATAVAAVTADAATPVETTAPEAAAATITAAATVIKSDGGKTETAAKNAETTPAQDSKDGKHAADTSAAKSSPDQAIKPETATSDTDGKPAQHDKAAAESGATETEPSKHAAKTAPQAEHRAAPSAPQPALQTDPGLQVPTGIQPQPVHTHAANLTAIPVPAANTAFADSAPVPLNGLAADIALRAAGGNSRFEIRLDPAELGRIDVRLEVDKHGNVTSHLTVERPATLDMLRNDAPRLQQALEDAGLKTGDSGLQFSLRDQSSSGRDGDNGSGRNSQRVVITEEDTIPAQVAGRSYGRMLGASSGVDIRI